MRREYTYIICLLLLLLPACKKSTEDRLSRLVSAWEKKELCFPSRSVFTVQGKDTVDFSYSASRYKVVTYVDSAGCISCKLQLHKWKSFMAEVDSLSGRSVPFIFYFHPKDEQELLHILRRDGFKHPVCIDRRDEFNSLNHFPSDMMFQTFLIDSSNKVVAMGNPIQKPTVRDLYLEYITGKRQASPAAEQTQVEIGCPQIDFGSFPYTERKEAEVTLTNKGSHPLAIHDVITSCGCTTVQYHKSPISTGDSTRLRISYQADKPEHFNKSIRVYCNAENSPLLITIRGNAQ